MTNSSSPIYAIRHLLVTAVLLALFVPLALKATSASRFGYDEADYMYAAKLGFVANYLDTPSMPLVAFVRTGLSRGRDPGQSARLSKAIRESNDVLVYRHWHGPLYFYWLIFTSHFAGDEYGTRVFTLFFPIISLLIIYFGCIWILGEANGEFAGIFSSLLFLLSAVTVRSVELAPHQAFVCCALACVMLVCKALATGRHLYFYGAWSAAALSCCLLEVGNIAVITLVLCGYFERRKLRIDWGVTWRSFLAFFSTVLVVWPAAIFKLSLVKGYLGMGYLAMFRKAPWGAETLAQIWRRRIFTSPVEWWVIAAALLLWIFLRRKGNDRPVLYPFAIFSGLMIAATLKVNTGTPRYALVFLPTLAVLAGSILAAGCAYTVRRAVPYGLAVALVTGLFLETWIDLERHPVLGDTRLEALLAYVRENHLETARMCVPQSDLPTLHYYFPGTSLLGYGAETTGCTPQDGFVGGVLYPGPPIRYDTWPLVRSN